MTNRTTRKTERTRRIRRLSVTITLDVQNRTVALKDSADFDKNVQLMIVRAGYMKVLQEALEAQPQSTVLAVQAGERGGKTASGLILPNTATVAAVNA